MDNIINLCKVKEKDKTQHVIASGFIFFLYSLVVSVAIQTFVVPKLFPQFDLGEGIIVLDSTGFNQIAKTKAAEILENGWKKWELRPQAQSPAGIASIFYVLLVPKPYSMLPFNALVHALTGCLVLWLLLHIFPWKPAFFGSILFVVNPAALQWVAQIHRDGIFILGNMLVLVCLVQFWSGLRSSNMRTMAWGFIGGGTGTVLAWVARPYFVQILLVFVVLGLLLISLTCLTTRVTRSGIKYQSLFLTFLALCLLLLQGWLVKYHSAEIVELPPVSPESSREAAEPIRKAAEAPREAPEPIREAAESPREASEPIRKAAESVEPVLVPDEKREAGTKLWVRTEWLPEIVEQKLYYLSVARRGAIGTGGHTVVDGDVPLNSASAFVTYFPRALQLGLLSPLPELWRGEASTPVMTLARKVVGVTTLFFYFCIVGLLFGMVSYRKNQVARLIFIFCFLGILVFAYTYPNIGTLLRFRYGFYMLLIAFGAANIAEMALRWQKKL